MYCLNECGFVFINKDVYRSTDCDTYPPNLLLENRSGIKDSDEGATSVRGQHRKP